MGTVFANMGNKLLTSTIVAMEIDDKSGDLQIWQKLDIGKLMPGCWYDYLDEKSGAVGQCKFGNYGVVDSGRYFADMNWKVPPAGWKDTAVIDNHTDDNIKYNERYQILNHLGRFTNVRDAGKS